MNEKIEKVLKELDEVNKQLQDCVAKMAYLRGLLEGLNPDNDA